MHKLQRRTSIRAAIPLQVAAVCYRFKRGSTEFLLIRTTSGRWTFPKGHLESGLSRTEVAAMEALEEAGVNGRVESRPIGRYLHRKRSLRGYRSKDVLVVAFLMEVKRSTRPAETHRSPCWFRPKDARCRLTEGRKSKYLRSLEQVFDCAIRKVSRKHG